MASNQEEVKRAALKELARRELARRQQSTQAEGGSARPSHFNELSSFLGVDPAEAQQRMERGQGLTTRSLVQGGLSPFTLLADPLAATANAALNVSGADYRFPSQSGQVSQELTSAGLPSPESTPEKIADFGLQALAGGITGKPFAPFQGVKGQAEAAKSAAQILDDAGVPLTTAQRGGAVSRAVAGSAGRAADTALGPSNFIQRQMHAFNSAIWNVFRKGAPESLQGSVDDAVRGARSATPGVMNRAKQVIQSSYDDLTKQVPTKVDDELLNQLAEFEKIASNQLSEDALKPMLSQIDEIISKASSNGGGVPGQAAQNIRTSLLQVEGSASPWKFWAGQIRRALDDAFERSAPKELADQMRWTRERFKMLKQIEDAVARNESGIVTPARLFNAMSLKRHRGQTIYGRGEQDLVELARAGKALLRDIPNSGSPQRLMDVGRIAAIFTNPALAAQVGGGALAGRALNENQALSRLLTSQGGGSLSWPALAALLASQSSIKQESQNEPKR